MFAFSVLSISFIALIWVFQAIFFTTIYENIKTSETKSILNSATKQYKSSPDYETKLLDLSTQKDASIVIFLVSGEQISPLFNSSRKSSEQDTIKHINAVLSNLHNASEASFISDSRADFKSLTCCKVINENNETIYISVTSTIAPVENLKDSFEYLLLFISVGVLCLALVSSYILSTEISKPITKMAKQAKEINNSNKLTPFEDSDYTEINDLSKTLNYAINELQKTDKIRREVMANVSHELKTPLTMIKSYTELIKDISGDNKEKRMEHLDIIHKEASKLEFLLNDMMDYSKLESGLISYNKKEFNLAETVHKLYSIYSEQHKDFAFSISSPKKVLIFGDEQRIEQVITNLLNNAINYSKEQKQIDIILKKVPNESKYKLEIIDKGIGISEENLKLVFDRHFRSSNARRATVGSGIGLSIVKSILAGHSFDFGVNSKENEGSNFYIIFPTPTKKESV